MTDRLRGEFSSCDSLHVLDVVHWHPLQGQRFISDEEMRLMEKIIVHARGHAHYIEGGLAVTPRLDADLEALDKLRERA